MRYIKPAILSVVTASEAIMGMDKSIARPDSSGGDPSFLSTAAAYEADE
ncbi:hypothetical protein [Terriglobus albidus]|nr:hypothetical protein [Terriglobus albidus]